MSFPERVRIFLAAFALTLKETVIAMRYIPAPYWLAMTLVTFAGAVAMVLLGL